MQRYMILEGKKGLLVGSPWADGRFICQQLKSRKEGEPLPKRMIDRYEPTKGVFPFHRDLEKAIRNGSITCHEKFQAADMKEASKRLEPAPAPAAKLTKKKAPALAFGDSK